MDIFEIIDNQCFHELCAILSEKPDMALVTDDYGRTPLHIAAAFESPESAKKLLESGTPVNAQDVFGKTPLHIAAYNGNLQVARLLVDNGANLSVKDRRGMIPANLALENRKGEIADILKSRQRELSDGLLASARSGDVDGVECALARGTSPDYVEKPGSKTAMHLAAEGGHVEVMERLARYGGSVESQDDSG